MLTSKVDVLVVEDNIHDVNFIRQAVLESGLHIKILHIQNGADAIDYMERCALTGDYPRMILTDLRMPKMDGYELISYIKASDQSCDIPLVVMSTSEQDCDVERSYRMGASSYLVKPMDVDIFIENLASLFRYWLVLNQPAVTDGSMASFMRFSCAA